LIDRKDSDATLRASRATNQPFTAALRSINQGRIHNLNEFLVGGGHSDGHDRSIS
jgi:hypothetical protein